MQVKGATALITGASAGIGRELAFGLAARGADVVLVARRVDRLSELAEQLRAQHGVTVTVIAADLAEPGAAAALVGELEDRELTIDILVNNAGFGGHGPFVRAEPARISSMIALNVTTVVELTRALLPLMVARRWGAVVNIASTAAFQPVPMMAVYGATKAFVLSFTEALWGELEGTGVAALALCPGATATEFFDVAGSQAAVGQAQDPAEVAELALGALEKDNPPPSVVAGRVNRVGTVLPRFVPRKVAIKVTRRVMTH